MCGKSKWCLVVMATVAMTGVVLGVGTSWADIVVNGDFEADAQTFVTWPGYVGGGGNPAAITGWTGTGGLGINPVVPGGPGDAPFRDNGGNDTTIALLQGNATLQQDLTGLTAGQGYLLSLDFNARNCCGDFPIATILLDGVVIGSSTDLFPGSGAVVPVGGTNPWHHAKIPFTAPQATVTLAFSSAPATGGDATLILDNINVITLDTLTWDGLGSNDWGSAHWVGNNPPPPPDFPIDDEVNTVWAVINSPGDTVTVAADRSALALDLAAGQATVGAGNTLAITGDLNAGGGTIALQDNSLLRAGGGGAIGTLNLAGTATVDFGADVGVTTLSDGGVAGTFSKQGAATLSVDSVTAGATTFHIQGGTLSVGGADPLGGSDALILDGGTFSVRGNPLRALYNFDEGGGEVVHDSSGVGTPLDMTIDTMANVTWNAAENSLSVLAPGTRIGSAGAATKIFDSVTASEEITVEAWVTPGLDSQSGPARIVTLSENASNRNFTLGQDGSTYDFRFRTTATSNNGTNPQVTAGTVSTALSHVVYTRDASGSANLYVDGDNVATGTIGGDTSNWNSSYRLGLGTEYDPSDQATRMWLGDYHLLAIYNQALAAEDVGDLFAGGPGVRTADTTRIDLSGTAVTVSAPSTFEILTSYTLEAGPLTMAHGGVLTTSGTGGVNFAGTTIAAAATIVGFDPQIPTDYGQIDASLAPNVVIAKAGPGAWALDADPVVGAPDSTWEVRGGTLSIQGADPIGGRPVSITGGTLSVAGGTAPLGGAAVELAGGALRVEGERTLAPGLLGGSVTGNLNATAANPGNLDVDPLGPSLSEITTKPPWADQTTFVYTGEIYIGPSGVASFYENIDDRTHLVIDGETLLDDSGWNTPTSGAITRPEGWYDFELRMSNGTGGVGAVGGFGFGYSPTDTAGSTDSADYTRPQNSDESTMDLFRALGFGPVDVSNVDLTVTGDSTLELVTLSTATVGTPTMRQGILTTTGARDGITMAGVNIDPAAAGKTVGFDPQVTTDVGVIHGNMVATTVAKAGSGNLVLDKANEGLDNATIEARGGVLTLVGPEAWGGAQKVLLSGGTLTARSSGVVPLVLYNFDEGAGDTVHDTSGVGAPLDLTVDNVNLVSWGADHLTVIGPDDVNETIIKSDGPAAKIIDALKATNEITIEAWVLPGNDTQDGPARIATLSFDGGSRNFTLAQEDLQYRARVRTDDPGITNNGVPEITTGNVVQLAAATHLVYTRDASGAESIYVDGSVQASGNRPGTLSNWNDGYEFALANEMALAGDREWSGEYHLMALYDRALGAKEIGDLFGDGPGPRAGGEIGAVDMSGVEVTVTADSVLNPITNNPLDVGPLTLQSGIVTLRGAGSGMIFAGTTVDAAAGGIVGVDLDVAAELGTINVVNPTPVTIAKSGPVDLVLTGSSVGTGFGSATFQVQEGRLIGVHGPNPFDTAALSITGGEIVLAAGADATYDNALTVEADGTLTAGSGGVGASGPLTVTLGGVNAVALTGGTLALRSTDQYLLNVAGEFSGPGGVNVTGGEVTFSGGGAADSLNVTGGVLNMDAAMTANSVDVSGGALNTSADLTVDSLAISNGSVNTDASGVVVGNRLTLGGTPYRIDAGNTFTVDGSDPLAGTDLILSGGKLSVGGEVVTAGLVALYDFEEGEGDTVRDTSGFDVPLDLIIEDATAVAWGSGLLEVIGPDDGPNETIIKSDGPATKIIDAIKDSSEITIEAWVLPGNDTQDGPARIATLSSDGSNRNFTLAQNDLQYRARLRTDGPGITNNGIPEITTGGVVQTTALTHLVYTRDASGAEAIYVDGNVEASGNRPGTMSNWDDGYEFALANEMAMAGDREWSGEYHKLAIYSEAMTQQDVLQNFVSGPSPAQVLADQSGVSLTVTADSTLSLSSTDDAVFGNLTLGDGLNLAIKGAAAIYQDVFAGDGSTIEGTLVLRGTLAVSDAAAGTLTIDGELEMDDTAIYLCDLAEGAADRVDVTSDAFLAGTLSLQAIGKLGEVGEYTARILSTIDEEAAIIDQFDLAQAAGDHLGYGVFHQEVTYDPDFTFVDVTAFQAAAGDTNGDRQVNNGDLQEILGAGSFGAGDGWGWGQGDFNGDGMVNNGDLQLILATGYFGTGSYAAAAGPTGGSLAAVPEPATIVLLAGGLLGLLLRLWRRRKQG